MNKYSFKDWLSNKLYEYADFGFDLQNKDVPKNLEDENPEVRLNIEYVCDQLSRTNLGIKEALDTYFGEVQWGNNIGAVKVVFGPYGGLRAAIKKLCVDLKGEEKWVCKKVVEVKEKYDRNADSLIQNILKIAEIVDRQQIDAPDANFKQLENLVLHMASVLRRTNKQKILIYEGIKKIKENEHYIIHFGCTGMGVQRQDQKRLDQFQVVVRYFPQEGYISVNGQELGDKIKSHKWIVEPAEFTEFYMPHQPKDEIIETILIHLNSY